MVETRADLAGARTGEGERPVALVPTMGALHAGHRQLMRRARRDDPAAALYVSIFVNPLQFGPGEDFDRYPRPIDADLEACGVEGADVVFLPSVEEMYGAGRPAVTVTAGELGSILEGSSRPGHFDGVLTVVAKLLHLVAPDAAYFGQKDAQQLALVRRMVRDLDFASEIVGVPTVRDDDGLALSSRNGYLDAPRRVQALALSRALDAGRRAAAHGTRAVLDEAGRVMAAADGVTLDYLELRDADTFGPVDAATTHGLLLAAAYVGGTRLIDNVTLDLRATDQR